MDLGVADRVVFVTGATRGIGHAIARAYADEGARVVVGYHNDKDTANALIEQLGGQRRSMAVRYCLEDPESAQRARNEVLAHFGGIDVLVANAFARGRRRSPDQHFEDVPDDDWRTVLSINVDGPINAIRSVLPGMRAAGWGRIVLVSSHVVRSGQRGQDYYAAAKSALHGLARSLSWDCAADGVLVNVVAPGLTTTDGVLTALPAQLCDAERQRTASGRLSDPADVASAVVYLGSSANRNITGEVLTVAGGR